MNLKPLNPVNNSISLVLIANSVSLSCSPGLSLKSCDCFVIFFSFKKFSLFFFSLYRGLLGLFPEPIWEIFSAGLIVLEKLQEVFGCSIITDFMSTMFRFSTVISY